MQNISYENESKYFHIINYGCQMNVSDSEHYAGQLESLGFTLKDNYNNADVVLLNTCCIRESAEQKIFGKIGELKHLKTAKPDSIIVVAGCLAQKEGEALLKKYRQIDLVLGTFYVNRFAQILQQFTERRQRQTLIDENIYENEFEGDIQRQSSFSAWVPIMYGCNNYCTYCIVPYVRGSERSRPMAEIVKEVTNAVKNGYKEITLLGQNVNSYGKDISDGSLFAELLSRVDEVPGIERIRFMTSHPRDMKEDVIKAIAESKHICEHFHLPIQAGSDRTIKTMNRGYKKEEYLKLIDMVRHYVPQASITTDMIVGFPGETEEDFFDTLDVVEKVQYDAAYTFLFSPRSGTPAAKMSDQIPLSVKKERLKRLMDLQNRISLEKNKALVNTVQEVMIEGKSNSDDNTLSGRTRTNKIIILPKFKEDVEPGEIVSVRVDTAQTWILKGTRVI